MAAIEGGTIERSQDQDTAGAVGGKSDAEGTPQTNEPPVDVVIRPVPQERVTQIVVEVVGKNLFGDRRK